MANNYQSRIELIVDDIAKDNVEFKAKTIAQQNAQKTDMILSISKSIAGLNDVGQNLVLNDIEKEVRENRIDIIDSSGNINVTELTRFTSTLVKAKIDEYERQGINLRLDSQMTRDSKISVNETVLSVAVINDMLSNFENLSFDEIDTLRSNFEFFNEEQMKKYDESMVALIENSGMSPEEKTESTGAFTDDFHTSIEKIILHLQEKYGKGFRSQPIPQEDINIYIDTLNISNILKDRLKKYSISSIIDADSARQEVATTYLQIDQAKKMVIFCKKVI